MYVLRLGVISSLLSETLVSGFTTAAAIHVFTSQIKDLLGLKLRRHKGIFKVIYVSNIIVKTFYFFPLLSSPPYSHYEIGQLPIAISA